MRSPLLEKHIEALHGVFDVYDSFSRDLAMACRPGCAHCCTLDVTMTTLEGYEVLRRLGDNGQTDLLKRVAPAIEQLRYRPAFTTNAFASACLHGQDMPPEDEMRSEGACPFLIESRCSIYEARPFHCRCFFSREICASGTPAIVDPFVITVNTVFLQVIEHLDQRGLFGNMTDVLRHLLRKTQTKGRVDDGGDGTFGLVKNEPMPALMIPPEDRQRIRPLLEELRNLKFEI